MCVLGEGGGGERERENWEINGVWPNYTNFGQLIHCKNESDVLIG